MSRHVLVIDDEDDFRGNLSDYLGLHGYAVTEAANGQAALEALAHLDEPPCFVVLDLRMPVMDGWQFLERLDADAIQGATICITTSSPESAPSGYAVLPKPVDLDRVLAAVHAACPAL